MSPRQKVLKVSVGFESTEQYANLLTLIFLFQLEDLANRMRKTGKRKQSSETKLQSTPNKKFKNSEVSSHLIFYRVLIV